MKPGLYIYIMLFILSHPVFAQDDFLSIYHKIDLVYQRQGKALHQNGYRVNDSNSIKEYGKYDRIFTDSILPLAKKIVNLTFPDISFTGINNKVYAISDFSQKDLIINYNYLYCQHCLDRVDSSLKWIENKNVQMLVLFTEPYQKEAESIKMYDQNVTIGFLNEDNKDLISLGMGDNSMYYLNKERQIEFFDRAEAKDHEIAWINFLKDHTK